MVLYTMFPPAPDVPNDQRGVATASLRYEDVAQDGRIRLTSLTHFLSRTLWQNPVARDTLARAAGKEGILPILTRLILEGGPGPHSVVKPVVGHGRFELAHTVDETGAVNRVLLNMWVEMTAPAARTHGPPPPNAGETLAAGRVFGEHVFTRPFAPREDRRVVSLPGLHGAPTAHYVWRPGEELLGLPSGATPLDEDHLLDETTIVFGLTHSDSNRHVSSLVYPNLFEEAALRRFHARGRGASVLARRMEVAYRKPCFAGETYRIVLRAYEHEGKLGATGVFVPAAGGRPHCHLAASFD